MFERFTVDARSVIVSAQEAAREMRHGYIGSEHLLLGLLSDPAELPSQLLSPLGVDRELARAKIIEIVGQGQDDVSSGQIPFTPRAKKVLELSLREALSLGHNDIRPGHVLLGLLREDEGVGTQVLLGFGVSAAELRAQVIEGLGKPDPPGIRQTLRRVEHIEHGQQLEFVARPDPELRRLLMRAAGLAFADDRESVTIADLLAVMQDLPSERSGTDLKNPGEQDASKTSG